MPSIQASGLTKKFGTLTAVDHLSFTVEEGEVLGLLGPNGAGKTTTIRLLSALLTPTEGGASVNNFDVVKDALRVRESIGILTENPSLYERLSAVENLNFFADAYGVAREKRPARIEELLKFFGLWERRNDRVGSFSKGMKQKLAIARALIHESKILFLDEPTAGLDPAAAKEIRDLIEKLSGQKKTILLSTHHLEDAEKIADRVIIINRGTAVTMGTPEQLERGATAAVKIRIELKETNDEVVKALKNSYELQENGTELIITVGDAAMIPDVVKTTVDKGAKIVSVMQVRASLEEAYLKIMGEGK